MQQSSISIIEKIILRRQKNDRKSRCNDGNQVQQRKLSAMEILDCLCPSSQRHFRHHKREEKGELMEKPIHETDKMHYIHHNLNYEIQTDRKLYYYISEVFKFYL